jgi:hypothetical protein
MLEKIIELITRGVVALEAMAKASERAGNLTAELLQLQKQATSDGRAAIAVTAVTAEMQPGTSDAKPGAAKKLTPADTPLEEANKIARESAAQAREEIKSGGDAAEKQAEQKQAKAPTVDEARAALKAYAAIEGNEAAMALLGKFDAKSVSALAEDKRADFIAACK